MEPVVLDADVNVRMDYDFPEETHPPPQQPPPPQPVQPPAALLRVNSLPWRWVAAIRENSQFAFRGADSGVRALELLEQHLAALRSQDADMWYRGSSHMDSDDLTYRLKCAFEPCVNEWKAAAQAEVSAVIAGVEHMEQQKAKVLADMYHEVNGVHLVLRAHRLKLQNMPPAFRGAFQQMIDGREKWAQQQLHTNLREKLHALGEQTAVHDTRELSDECDRRMLSMSTMSEYMLGNMDPAQARVAVSKVNGMLREEVNRFTEHLSSQVKSTLAKMKEPNKT